MEKTYEESLKEREEMSKITFSQWNWLLGQYGQDEWVRRDIPIAELKAKLKEYPYEN